MRRITLPLLAVAVAAVSCLTVLSVLREPPSSAAPRAVTPATKPAAVAAAPSPTSARAPAPDPALDLADAARTAQAQEQRQREAILGIAADEDLPLDARLARYREAAAEAPGMPVAHPGVLAEAFLRNEAVQEELAALSPAARSGQIARIRRELGFAEDEIARMETIDERREARWQNGLAYMQERARLTSTFEGEVLAEEIHHLRERHFAHEAPTIEREERDGFFRFERPRVYGRN